MIRYFVLSFSMVLLPTGYLWSQLEQDNNLSTILTKEDSNRILKNIHIGKMLINTDPDSAEQMLLSTLKESRSHHFIRGMAESFLMLSLNAKKKLNYMVAEDYISEASRLFLSGFKDSSLFIDLLNISGLVAHDQGQYAKAEEAHYKAIILLEGKNNCKDKLQMAASLQYLAEVKTRKNELEKATLLLNRAETIGRECRDRQVIMKVYLNKSNLYYLKDDLEVAIRYADSVIALSKSIGSLTMYGKALNNKGLWLQMRGNLQQSIPVFEESIHIADSIDNPIDKILALANLGKSWLLLKKFDTAEQLLIQALKTAEQSGFKNGVSVAYDYLSELYIQTDRPEKAIKNLKKFNNYLQEYYNTEKQRIVSELDIRYQTALKEKHITENRLLIEKQDRRIEKQRALIWIVSGTAGLIILFSALLFLQQNRLRNNRILRLNQEKQIALLKNTMTAEEQERKRIAEEIHDGIGGMLAALKMNFTTLQETFNITRESSAKSLVNMLDETAKEVRRTTHNLMPDALYRYGLITAIKRYLNRIRETNNLEIHLQVPHAIPLGNKSFELALYRIFQELIQNIIKHANARQIFIQIYREGNLLSFMIEDDGIGYSTETEYEGIGLKNIKNRVNSFGGTLTIQSAPTKGTLVHIEFNMENIQNLEA